MHDSLQCMTLGTTLYSIWHADTGKQSVAAAHLRPNGSAADLPFGDGPIDLGRLRRWRDRKLGFSMFWPLGGPLGPQEGQNYIF